ncbi:MAG: SUMF1/EgtB/PvdO family nonheme iron enzyme [Candidatus Cloacimonadaceae bacterium]
MKTRIILIIMLSFVTLGLFSQIVLSQGFEQSPQDNWNYTAIPQPNRLVWWGPTDQPLGGASAQAGDWYWASWDLDDINHSLVFDNHVFEAGYIYDISFWYFSKNLNPTTDYCRYALSFDGGTSWEAAVELDTNTDAWTQAQIEIPAYAQSVMLKVEASYDGFSKYMHWDSFTMQREEVYPMAPIVYNFKASQRRDGSMLIDISYQLYDANGDDSTISVFVSLDGGVTYDYEAQNLSGDWGDNIPSGTTGHIVWDAGAEDIIFDSDTCCIAIMAEDHTTGMVPTPAFDPPGGSIFEMQTISISCAIFGASIYYTLDGTNPDEGSTPYTSPIIIDSSTTLKARAYKENWLPSEIAEAEYSITPAGFVYVPGGTFHNGTSNVTVSSFYIGKYELTQAEYEAVMGSNPASGYGVGANYPVYYVSWFKAIEYCNRRSIMEGLTPCYSYDNHGSNPNNWPSGWNSSSSNHSYVSCDWIANGYRLPTEMEWMYAAKGGNQSQGYTYSGSNTIGDVAWYRGNSGSTTHVVGTKAPNELGIYDMSGNVWEWCWDIYNSYPGDDQTDPHGATSGSDRVRRGGGWGSYADYCTVSARSYDVAPYSGDSVGFRIFRVFP